MNNEELIRAFLSETLDGEDLDVHDQPQRREEGWFRIPETGEKMRAASRRPTLLRIHPQKRSSLFRRVFMTLVWLPETVVIDWKAEVAVPGETRLQPGEIVWFGIRVAKPDAKQSWWELGCVTDPDKPGPRVEISLHEAQLNPDLDAIECDISIEASDES